MIKDWHMFSFFAMILVLSALAFTSSQLPGGITGMVTRDSAINEETEINDSAPEIHNAESDETEMNEYVTTDPVVSLTNQTQTNNTNQTINNTTVNSTTILLEELNETYNNTNNTNISVNNITPYQNIILDEEELNWTNSNNTLNYTNITINSTNNNSNTTGNLTNTTIIIREEQKTNIIDSFFTWFGKLFSSQ